MQVLDQATRQLTLDLVSMPSVNGTPGEAAVVTYLHHRLSRNPAVQQGRMRLFLLPCQDDPLFRPVLVAHRVGTGHRLSGVRSGVLLFGHIDTVGIADYGPYESLACRPREWTDLVAQGALGPDAAARAKSGNWLFGRGTLDMKAGVAAALTAFEALAADTDLEADVFFSATPDEEGGSLGVKTLAAWLRSYLPTEQIVMRAAINTDYTTWQNGDGGARHIYLGSIGKLLPAVYVQGVPSHAAQAEMGIDPNLVVAAITRRIVYQERLRDRVGEETSPPPVCLYQRDDKLIYDVQTAVSASAYYNLFHMTRTPGAQLERFVAEVRGAVTDLQEAHPDFLSSDIPVVTFGDLWEEVSEAVRMEVRAFADSLTLSQDLRERCRLITACLLHKSDRTGPCVVVYFGTGLVPRVDSGEQIRARLTDALAQCSAASGERFAVHRHFPFISDLSFLTPSTDWDDGAFARNFPSVYTASPAPQRELPTLMVGTYGTGAHQPDECVDAAYTFGRLPDLLQFLTRRLLDAPRQPG